MHMIDFYLRGFLGLHVKQWLQIDEVGQGEICDGGYNFIFLSYSNCRVSITQGKGYLTLKVKHAQKTCCGKKGFIL